MEKIHNRFMQKGTIFDIGAIFATILITVIVSFFAIKFYSAYQPLADNIFNNTLNNRTDAINETNIVLHRGSEALNVAPNMIPFLIIGLFIASMISAAMIPTNPSFLIFSILLLALYIVGGVVVTDILWAFINNSEFSSIANNFPITVEFIRYFVIVTGIMGFGIIIFMYSKSGGNGIGY